MNNPYYFTVYIISTTNGSILLQTLEYDEMLDYLMDNNLAPYQIIDVDLAIGHDCSYFIYSLYSHNKLVEYAIEAKQEALKYDIAMFNRICNPTQMLRDIGVKI